MKQNFDITKSEYLKEEQHFAHSLGDWRPCYFALETDPMEESHRKPEMNYPPTERV